MGTSIDWDHRVAQQRSGKADRLANHLQAVGVTAPSAARYTADQRRAAEREAGTRKGSSATWRLVVEMLAGSAGRAALCQTCGIGDPLGMPGPPKRHGHQGLCSQ